MSRLRKPMEKNIGSTQNDYPVNKCTGPRRCAKGLPVKIKTNA
jgi:hypothetical protein